MYYILCMFCILLLNGFKIGKKQFMLITFGVMGVFAGLRSKIVGVDTGLYHFLYDWTIQYPLNWTYVDDAYFVELGPRILMKVAEYIFNDSQGFIFISAMMTYIFLGVFCYKNINNKYYWLSPIILFGFGFWSYSLCVIRQALAISIACNALQFFKNEDYFKGFCIVLFASLFHISILILLPLYVLFVWVKKTYPEERYKWQIMIFLSFLLIFLGMFYSVLMDQISVIFNDKYLGYLIEDNNANVTFHTFFTILIYLLVIVLILYIHADNDYNVFFISAFMIMMAVFMYIMQFKLNILYRFINVFDIYLSIIIPLMIGKTKLKVNRDICSIIVVLFSFVNLIYFIVWNTWGAGNYILF